MRFDVAVVGAGPAGSIAAHALSRGGARTCLIDPAASFPRDKACGDLIGPRGVRLLEQVGIAVTTAASGRDIILVGPTGNQARLEWRQGSTYADHAIAVPRTSFDNTLRAAALDAGAVAVTGRVVGLMGDPGRVEGVRLADGTRTRADFVVGADGARSTVASAAGLVDPRKVLWGFALRFYVQQSVELPHIVAFEPKSRRVFPGYGWLFPSGDGRANLGLGMGTLHERTGATELARHLDGFVTGLRSQGLINEGVALTHRRGGWLKMGMAGTRPARGRVLLVGDAAGLVNPLQGEGISQALMSGRAAAQAILGQGDPAASYLSFLSETFGSFHASAAALHAMALPRPLILSAGVRTLTSPFVARVISDAWALYWNDLVEGAYPGWARTKASAIGRLAGALTVAAGIRRGVEHALDGR
jgi:geranylgeranyl reductase family protein